MQRGKNEIISVNVVSAKADVFIAVVLFSGVLVGIY